MITGHGRAMHLLAFIAISIFTLATPGAVLAHHSLPDSPHPYDIKGPSIADVKCSIYQPWLKTPMWSIGSRWLFVTRHYVSLSVR
jgi:hypothetical protein